MYTLDEPCEVDREPVRIAVLQNHPEGYTGRMVASYLEEAGADVTSFEAYKGELPDPNDFDGIIGSGSPYNVREHRDDEWLQAEQELYRSSKRPVLGICFAHQLLAESYGGRTDKAEGYDLERGPTKVHLTQKSPLFKGLDDEVIMAEYHGDEVTEVPRGFKVTAYSDLCEVQGIQHKRKPVYAVQFHPEWGQQLEDEGIDNDAGYQLLDNFLDIAQKAKVRRESPWYKRVGLAIGDGFDHLFGDE